MRYVFWVTRSPPSSVSSLCHAMPCRVMFPGTKETPYELNAENRFTELENPFEEGVRLFEEGQIADAALCFEAEIARNPENSQVWVDILPGGSSYCSWPARFLGLLVFRFASCRG